MMERTELIAILNVAAAMHRIFCCIHNRIDCDGKICMLLPFVNLGFLSYCISNECLPIQLGMFNVMGNQFSYLYLCLMTPPGALIKRLPSA